MRQSLGPKMTGRSSAFFANPRQFGPKVEDYEGATRTPEMDTRLLQNLGVSAVFMPSESEMYSPEDEFHISATRLSRLWCSGYLRRPL